MPAARSGHTAGKIDNGALVAEVIAGRAGRPVRFGIQTPQENATYEELKAHWIEADRLGYDSIFLDDHMLPVMVAPNSDQLDAFGILPALAASTEHIRVGVLVADNDYRHPALLARMIHAVDVITDGRAIFGAGAGWFSAEYDAYGIHFDPPKTRNARLREGIEIYKLISTEEVFNFSGQYYSIRNLRSAPKPVQKPWPPILIGASGEKFGLRTVAEHADIWNFGGSPEEFASKLRVLERHCTEVGRDPENIEVTWFGQVVIDEDPQRVAHRMANRGQGLSVISGTPDEVSKTIAKYIDVGVTSFYAMFGRVSNLSSTRLFAQTVMAEYS